MKKPNKKVTMTIKENPAFQNQLKVVKAEIQKLKKIEAVFIENS
jgi:hypothetical protein